MTISRIKWGGWDAVKCTTGDSELIAGISAGPRILSLRYRNGDNLLHEDKTDFRVGDWRIYGGHRFSTAPENDESYYPDNAPCAVEIAQDKLLIRAPQRPNGLRLSLLIAAAAGEEGFDIQHILENEGGAAWEGALWAITCVPRAARMIAGCTTQDVHCWPGTDPLNWQVTDGQMTVRPGDFRGKTGWYEAFPRLAAIQPQGTLVIQSPDKVAADDCADNGCNVEIFVCAGFMELETLGGKQWIAPGSRASHVQQWRLFP